jgi:hypothetical protein
VPDGDLKGLPHLALSPDGQTMLMGVPIATEKKTTIFIGTDVQIACPAG